MANIKSKFDKAFCTWVFLRAESAIDFLKIYLLYWWEIRISYKMLNFN